MLGLKWTGGLVAQLTPPGVSNENVKGSKFRSPSPSVTIKFINWLKLLEQVVIYHGIRVGGPNFEPLSLISTLPLM